jgi:hypothetical protein
MQVNFRELADLLSIALGEIHPEVEHVLQSEAFGAAAISHAADTLATRRRIPASFNKINSESEQTLITNAKNY